MFSKLKLKCNGSSKVERQVEALRVAGASPARCTIAPVTQRPEFLFYKQGAVGSTPTRRTKFSRLYRLTAKTADCRSVNRSSILRTTANTCVAQWSERGAHNAKAGCSIQPTGIKLFRAGDQGERDGLLNRIQAGSIPALGAKFPASSNGRKADFESVNCGSIPRAGSI